ncbi:hypothetical protein KDM92_11670 [Undibacterium sp. BYS107W]|uniref:Uncharacterized protein n=2 Tax=Undibacterium baiyunense TaxID=2828731 RepID=A0A941DGK9_9BURK|nr:hypothetical protein [Undibacterium baiyunense]
MIKMTIDETASAISRTSPDVIVQGLSRLLVEWKLSAANVNELQIQVERYIGNSWISDDSTHAAVDALWSAFCKTAIGCIGGMSINERLYHFGLLEMFDNASSSHAREVIYAKLLAVQM